MSKVKSLAVWIKDKITPKSKAEWRILSFCPVIYCCFLILIIVSAVDTAVNDSYFFVGSSIFFQDEGDVFMDFFNVNYFVQDMNPYIGSGSSYPPMVLLFAKIFQLIQGAQESASVVRLTTRGMISLLIYFGIFFICAWILLRIYLKRHNIHLFYSLMLYIALAITAPVLFAIDRGNYLLYAFLFVAYFLLYYKSEKRWQRELSYVALALAVSFKIYPAIFALLLLNKKDWLNLIKTAVYSVLLVLLPMFAFEGGYIENLKCFLENLLDFQSQSNGYFYADENAWYLNGYYNTVSFSGVVLILCSRISGTPIANLPSYTGTIATIVAFMLAIVAVVAVFMTENRWVKIYLITSVMTFVLSTNYEYNLIFFIYPLLMYLADDGLPQKEEGRKGSIWDKIYFIACGVLLTLIFIPLPMGYFIPKSSHSLQHGYPVLDLVQVIAYLALTVLLIVISITAFCKRMKLKKSVSAEQDGQTKQSPVESPEQNNITE